MYQRATIGDTRDTSVLVLGGLLYVGLDEDIGRHLSRPSSFGPASQHVENPRPHIHSRPKVPRLSLCASRSLNQLHITVAFPISSQLYCRHLHFLFPSLFVGASLAIHQQSAALVSKPLGASVCKHIVPGRPCHSSALASSL